MNESYYYVIATVMADFLLGLVVEDVVGEFRIDVTYSAR